MQKSFTQIATSATIGYFHHFFKLPPRPHHWPSRELPIVEKLEYPMNVQSLLSLFKRPLTLLSTASLESTKCLALGFRDALHPRLIGFSLGVWLVTFAVWLSVFIIWWDAIGLLATFLAEFIALGIFMFMPQRMPFGLAQTTSTLSEMANIGPALMGTSVALVVLHYLLIAALFAGAMLISIRVLLELFLMGRIQKQALKTYPHLPTDRSTSFYAGIRNLFGSWFTFLIGGGICLMIPVLNGVLLFGVLSYLNVRGLVNDALDGIADDNECRQVIESQRLTMTVLGIGLVGIMLIPFVALIGPTLTGSSVCHLCIRKLTKLRENASSTNLGAAQE